MVFDLDMIKKVYAKYPERIAAARQLLNKPLTLSEKILYTHLWEGNASAVYKRGASYVDFAPETSTALQLATTRALQGNPLLGSSQQEINKVLSGDYVLYTLPNNVA